MVVVWLRCHFIGDQGLVLAQGSELPAQPVLVLALCSIFIKDEVVKNLAWDACSQVAATGAGENQV